MVAVLLLATCLAAPDSNRGAGGLLPVAPTQEEVPALGITAADTLEVQPIGPRALLDSIAAGADPLELSRLGESGLDNLLEEDAGILFTADDGTERIADAQEALHDLAVWKVDLNDASEDELEGLPGLTAAEAALLVAYRKANGPIRRISDLANAGLSPETTASILPYVSFGRRPRLSVRAEVVQRWSRRLTRTEGYQRDSTKSHYLGTPDALMTRLKIKLGNRIVLGAVLEKDAGEPFDAHRTLDLGHDFAAGYAMVNDVGPFRRIVLGDFASQVGEGLLFGQNTRIGSGPRSFRIRTFVRPHSSSREYGFFRGAAVQSRSLFGFSVAAGISRKPIDARYDSVDGTWKLSATGLHRTESERLRKQQAHEWVIGWMLAYHRGGFRFGVAGADTRRQINTRTTPLPTSHDASGPAQSVSLQTIAQIRSLTGYAAWTGSRLGIAAEVAPRDSGLATSVAFGYAPSRATEFWLEAVRSTPGGEAPHSSVGVDGQGEARRETTWSAGVLVRPSPKWSWTLATRRRRRPTHPMEGSSISTSSTIEIRPASWIVLRLRGVDQRDEPLGSCASPGRVLRCSLTQARQSFRLQVDYVHSRALRHRFHVEVSQGTPESDARRRGILMYKDVRWKPSPMLQLDARLLFFEITDFAARIYAFENDLLYSFSAPVYSGRGRRSYVLVRYAVNPRLSLQLKYGVSTYEDVDSVGSGLEETAEPVRKDIRIQLRWTIGARRALGREPPIMMHLV